MATSSWLRVRPLIPCSKLTPQQNKIRLSCLHHSIKTRHNTTEIDSLLVGLPQSILTWSKVRHQHVQNCAARLILNAYRFEHNWAHYSSNFTGFRYLLAFFTNTAVLLSLLFSELWHSILLVSLWSTSVWGTKGYSVMGSRQNVRHHSVLLIIDMM